MSRLQASLLFSLLSLAAVGCAASAEQTDDSTGAIETGAARQAPADGLYQSADGDLIAITSSTFANDTRTVVWDRGRAQGTITAKDGSFVAHGVNRDITITVPAGSRSTVDVQTANPAETSPVTAYKKVGLATVLDHTASEVGGIDFSFGDYTSVDFALQSSRGSQVILHVAPNNPFVLRTDACGGMTYSVLEKELTIGDAVYAHSDEAACRDFASIKGAYPDGIQF